MADKFPWLAIETGTFYFTGSPTPRVELSGTAGDLGASYPVTNFYGATGGDFDYGDSFQCVIVVDNADWVIYKNAVLVYGSPNHIDLSSATELSSKGSVGNGSDVTVYAEYPVHVIGDDVQAYDADTAKYDDVTANFTGSLQKSGSNVITAAGSIADLTTKDHDLLDGLSDDDHSQYALLAGRDGESLAIDEIKAYDGAGLKLYDDGGNGIFVEDGGNVGIGTTSPDAKLAVSGGVAEVLDTGNADITTKSFSTNNNHRPRMSFRKSHSDTLGTLSETQDGEELGRFQAAGVNSSGNNSAGAVQINFKQDGSAGATYVPGLVEFATSDGTSGAAARMTIDSSGKVGIGTTSPSYQLQLSTNSAAKPTSGSWTIASDRRIKNIIKDFTKGLDEIIQINPVVYEYKKDNVFNIVDPGEHQGIIAQEIESIFPEAITKDEIGYLHFNNDTIILALINAVKELKNMITAQQI